MYSLAVVQIEFLLLERRRLLLQGRLQLQLVGGQHVVCSFVYVLFLRFVGRRTFGTRGG